MNPPKLLIIGHARHGKDTVSEMLHEMYGLSFQSSSYYCAEKFIFDELKHRYNYNTVRECYDDRHAHRREWYQLIRNYNLNDDAKLGRDILSEYDVYCGLRDVDELVAIKKEGIVDNIIWVDRSKVLPNESNQSMTLTSKHADIVIDNNGSLEHLENQVKKMLSEFYTRGDVHA